MENEKYMNLGSEAKLVDTLEHMGDMEGIFFDLRGEKRDARQLITIYNELLENWGFDNLSSFEILRKRNDFVNYLSKINGEQLTFFAEMYKKWKPQI